MTRAQLMLTRGLPGSGKSTWAREWVNEDPQTRMRMNRDDFRFMGFAEYVLQGNQEDAVTTAQHAAVEALLRAGRDVVVDDTNLSARGIRAWYAVADRAHADIEFHDMETTLEQAQEWNANREKKVASEVVQRFYDRYYKKGSLPPVPERRADETAGALYVPDTMKPRAWLFDIDGTLALNKSGRGFYDWHRVGEDSINESVARIAKIINNSDLGDDNHPDMLIVMSGRDGSCRAQTEAWLDTLGFEYEALYMRQAGDMRKDNTVKTELFDAHVRYNYFVQGVFDDRDQVVEMWRALGLVCFQVAPGDF